MSADWYARNGIAARAKVRQWTAANSERVAAYRVTNRRRSYLQEAVRKYGVAADWFDVQMEKQGNKCATCAKTFDWGDKQTKPHIDHCHATGNVRGLLCNRCNTVLGLAEENKGLLSTLVEYLKCHG
jgi:hypothetical protein